jgi:hypothetical protein
MRAAKKILLLVIFIHCSIYVCSAFRKGFPGSVGHL